MIPTPLIDLITVYPLNSDQTHLAGDFCLNLPLHFEWPLKIYPNSPSLGYHCLPTEWYFRINYFEDFYYSFSASISSIIGVNIRKFIPGLL